MKLPAQGWYHDPYALHEDRYFSAGRPTKLVRDGATEAYADVPDEPLPIGELVPAADSSDDDVRADDLRRADDGDDGLSIAARERRAAFDAFDQRCLAPVSPRARSRRSRKKTLLADATDSESPLS